MKAHRHGGIYNNQKLIEDGKQNVLCMWIHEIKRDRSSYNVWILYFMDVEVLFYKVYNVIPIKTFMFYK